MDTNYTTKTRYTYDKDGYVYDTQKSPLPMSKEKDEERARQMAEYWNWFEYYDWMRAHYSTVDQMTYIETFLRHDNPIIKASAIRYMDRLVRARYLEIE